VQGTESCRRRLRHPEELRACAGHRRAGRYPSSPNAALRLQPEPDFFTRRTRSVSDAARRNRGAKELTSFYPVQRRTMPRVSSSPYAARLWRVLSGIGAARASVAAETWCLQRVRPVSVSDKIGHRAGALPPLTPAPDEKSPGADRDAKFGARRWAAASQSLNAIDRWRFHPAVCNPAGRAVLKASFRSAATHPTRAGVGE
jgi:hypothetical protein